VIALQSAKSRYISRLLALACATGCGVFFLPSIFVLAWINFRQSPHRFPRFDFAETALFGVGFLCFGIGYLILCRNPNYKAEKSALVMLTVVILLASSFGLLFLFGYVGSSGVRVSREHGLKIPPSAHSFVCGGDAWMHWSLDSGAASAFEMASNDLPSFLSQLKIRQTHEGGASIFPENSKYEIRRPWTSGIPLKTYRCTSRTGDSLDVQIWKVDDATAGILLYTDWN
jgi:hypothetical protein